MTVFRVLPAPPLLPLLLRQRMLSTNLRVFMKTNAIFSELSMQKSLTGKHTHTHTHNTTQREISSIEECWLHGVFVVGT